MEWLGHVVNFYCMEVQLIYNVVLGIQQSDSIIHVHICVCIYLYILFQILFPYRLLKDSEYSSLCYTFKLNMVAQTPVTATASSIYYLGPLDQRHSI